MISSPAINRNPVISFLLIAIFFQIVGGMIGWLSAGNVDGWYQGLERSPLTPPDAAFGIVWSMLYLLLAVSLWRLLRTPDSPTRLVILRLFAAHMILNWCWNPLFFIGHALAPSFFLILVLIFTAAMIGWLSWKEDRYAALVFAPYIGWLVFAGHLSHYIWMQN